MSLTVDGGLESQRVNWDLASVRLLLQPLRVADLNLLHRLWTDEQVRKFLWDDKMITLDLTEEILQKNECLFRDSGFGLWGVREHNRGELIGFAGYWYFRTPPCLELLFGVTPAHWNQGLATEASSLVIRYGFDVLGFGRVEASADFANTASIRVFDKLSMTFSRRSTVDGLDTVFYSMTRDEWLRRVDYCDSKNS